MLENKASFAIGTAATQGNFRDLALERIMQTPAISQLAHLSNFHWGSNSDFWKWLAFGDEDAIVLHVPDLLFASLRRISFHEAGHAVVQHLLYDDIVSATIVPDPTGTGAGEVISERNRTPVLEYAPFIAWKFIVGLLAAPVVEEKALGSLLHDGPYNDVLQAIDYVKKVYLADYPAQQRFIDWGLLGAYRFVN